jgi:hypothetical protein
VKKQITPSIENLASQKRRKNKMAEEQKKTQKDFRAFFEGTPCADMMKKMMEGKMEGQTFNCAEMMSRMMAKFGRKCGPTTPGQTGKASSTET